MLDSNSTLLNEELADVYAEDELAEDGASNSPILANSPIRLDSRGRRTEIPYVSGPPQPPVIFKTARNTMAEFWAERRQLPAPEPYRLSYALAMKGECRLLQTILEDNGFQLTNARSFNLLWLNCQVKPALLLSLNRYQKVNHFPRTHELTRKDLLVRTLTAMREAHGPSACDFLPTTFVLPADSEACHAAMTRERGATWIVKPIASSRGRGISIVQQPHQLPQDDVVVSRYVSNPLLIDGFKFDLRLYVAVTSFHPLRIHCYDEGLVRFSTEPYQNGGGAALKNLFMHLTNYSINKHSAHFVPNHDAANDDHGNKWSLSALRRCLARNGVDVDALFKRIDALVVRTLISVEPSVTAACRRYCAQRSCAFELFGFDVLIDDQLKVWLLEVNLSPSLAVESPLDLKIKNAMLSELLTLAAIRPYDREAHRQEVKRKGQLRYERMARGEPAARQTFRHKPIDQSLSAEALRAISEMDEEAQRAGGWRRLFPTHESHAHRHLFAAERPLNTLLVDILRKRMSDDMGSPSSGTDLDAIAFAPPTPEPPEEQPTGQGNGSGGGDASSLVARAMEGRALSASLPLQPTNTKALNAVSLTKSPNTIIRRGSHPTGAAVLHPPPPPPPPAAQQSNAALLERMAAKTGMPLNHSDLSAAAAHHHHHPPLPPKSPLRDPPTVGTRGPAPQPHLQPVERAYYEPRSGVLPASAAIRPSSTVSVRRMTSPRQNLPPSATRKTRGPGVPSMLQLAGLSPPPGYLSEIKPLKQRPSTTNGVPLSGSRLGVGGTTEARLLGSASRERS